MDSETNPTAWIKPAAELAAEAAINRDWALHERIVKAGNERAQREAQELRKQKGT
ncbi:hypothetical protein [Kibdelosporangium phytohabitans]|uniref:hypothetical protein n=1 Tax=Kibdelosporangium phytohabitans TaxID=860235 RepID=UPI0012FA5490|nr:hypothetical protein [Kibdelosporangium phytohabitans]MBE1467577.1 hypothetical protein [Kibdelosporangium phytohabitans]